MASDPVTGVDNVRLRERLLALDAQRWGKGSGTSLSRVFGTVGVLGHDLRENQRRAGQGGQCDHQDPFRSPEEFALICRRHGAQTQQQAIQDCFAYA
jgi:hypothetical protein